MRALVIDDVKAMRSLLKFMLKEIGFEVFEASDGQEGLECLKEIEQPDVVLCDWNMPGMNGYEFLRALRSDHNYDGVRLMMVTTETDMEHVCKALEGGADEYLMKPFTKEMIHEKLTILGVGGRL